MMAGEESNWMRERAKGTLPKGSSSKDRARNGADTANRASAVAKHQKFTKRFTRRK